MSLCDEIDETGTQRVLCCELCCQETIDQALVMIQNADPTGDVGSDPPELSTLEGCLLAVL